MGFIVLLLIREGIDVDLISLSIEGLSCISQMRRPARSAFETGQSLWVTSGLPMGSQVCARPESCKRLFESYFVMRGRRVVRTPAEQGNKELKHRARVRFIARETASTPCDVGPPPSCCLAYTCFRMIVSRETRCVWPGEAAGMRCSLSLSSDVGWGTFPDSREASNFNFNFFPQSAAPSHCITHFLSGASCCCSISQ